MKIACLIIDDEPAAREILQQYVADDARLDLVALCSNAFEANAILEKQKIDLLFLDINMPRLSGLAFYKSLSKPPAVIFTTAYPEYAVEGFEVDAVDYLLKPFTFERFFKAVSKVAEKKQDKKQSNIDFILLYADKKMYKAHIDDIAYLEAQGDYVSVYMRDKQLLVHDSLQRLHRQMPAKQFIRIHKSFVVAINKFDYIEGNTVAIQNKYLPIGETYRKDFFKAIKALDNKI